MIKYVTKDTCEPHCDEWPSRATDQGPQREPNPNEVERFQDARDFGSMEACWRTFEFELYGRTPPVQALGCI